MRAGERHRDPGHWGWGWWWLVASVWWTLDGVTGASNQRRMAAQAGNPLSWDTILRVVMPSSWLWIPVTVFALWMADRYPLGRGTWRRYAPAHLAAIVAVLVGRAAVVVGLNPWFKWYPDIPPFYEVLIASFGNNFFLYVILVGFGHAVVYARRAREREEQLARAELSALKMQLHPHFLFNTLNAVISFVRSDPAVAERMIARLSELLRHTLQNAGVHEVALSEEIRFAESYLEIEQTRFGDRLRVHWNVEPGIAWARVPHLVLQPLVENAVRHGIGPRGSGGTVTIEARRRGEMLQVTVRDDGVGMVPGDVRPGVGLSNTRARLAQLYGDEHTIEVDGSPGAGVSVRITIPLRAGPLSGSPDGVMEPWADLDDSALAPQHAGAARMIAPSPYRP